MRSASLVIAVVLLPVTARGALTLRIEDVTVCPGETTFAELYFEETPPARNDELIVYNLQLGIVGDPGLRFGPAEQVGQTVDRPFVNPRFVVHVLEATARSLSVFAEDPLGILNGVPVSDGEGVLRIPVAAAPGTPAGQASLVFDVDLLPGEYPTEFVDEIGNVIPVTLRSGTVTICPEPSAAAVALFGAGLVTLRRRRR